MFDFVVTPYKDDLTVYQGATFRKHWQWLSGGLPVDLTGCQARMQVRQDIDAPDVLLSLTTENKGITLSATGDVRLYMGAAQTEALDWDGGVYDLEIVFPDGEVVRLFFGTVRVSREVTRG